MDDAINDIDQDAVIPQNERDKTLTLKRNHSAQH